MIRPGIPPVTEVPAAPRRFVAIGSVAILFLSLPLFLLPALLSISRLSRLSRLLLLTLHLSLLTKHLALEISILPVVSPSRLN